MLTFENILELFQEYLLCDPEEEVLSCKRGYVRLTWNKDSRYCVDGILCRTPEELFDILLSDFQDFAMICRTRGRREVTEEDEKAVEELCQPYDFISTVQTAIQHFTDSLAAGLYPIHILEVNGLERIFQLGSQVQIIDQPFHLFAFPANNSCLCSRIFSCSSRAFWIISVWATLRPVRNK